MRKDWVKGSATIHPFPVRDIPAGGNSVTRDISPPQAAQSPPVACFGSWYHDEAIKESCGEGVPADPKPRKGPGLRLV